MGQWWSQGGYWGANGGGMSGVFKTEEDFSAKTWKHNAVAWNQGTLGTDSPDSWVDSDLTLTWPSLVILTIQVTAQQVVIYIYIRLFVCTIQL